MVNRNAVGTGAKRLAGRALMWKLGRAIPIVGVVFALLGLRSRIREKGPLRGSADTALDMTPLVGRMKAVYELVAGDIIAPKRAHGA